jgi:predicted DNA-binding WGR domain protein
MSDWTVHLEFEEGNSSKFWRARVEGKTLYVNYGKIGSNGQTQVKDLADPAAAKKEYDKLVAEKRKKGYVDTGAGAGRSPDGGGDDGDDDAASGGGKSGADDEEDGEDEDDEDERPARKPASKRAPAAAPAARPAAAAAPKAAAAPRTPGHRLVLDAGGRQVETTLYLDGNTLRMDSQETYASPEAASKAFERLKKLLAGEGYQAG